MVSSASIRKIGPFASLHMDDQLMLSQPARRLPMILVKSTMVDLARITGHLFPSSSKDEWDRMKTLDLLRGSHRLSHHVSLEFSFFVPPLSPGTLEASFFSLDAGEGISSCWPWRFSYLPAHSALLNPQPATPPLNTELPRSNQPHFLPWGMVNMEISGPSSEDTFGRVRLYSLFCSCRDRCHRRTMQEESSEVGNAEGLVCLFQARVLLSLVVVVAVVVIIVMVVVVVVVLVVVW